MRYLFSIIFLFFYFSSYSQYYLGYTERELLSIAKSDVNVTTVEDGSRAVAWKDSSLECTIYNYLDGVGKCSSTMVFFWKAVGMNGYIEALNKYAVTISSQKWRIYKRGITHGINLCYDEKRGLYFFLILKESN
ncbi:MAG: hypothetical protein JSS76_14015 [Bacteroidetes bacterium]|nr:hypothetical protein [Bacteroidota bacterium]